MPNFFDNAETVQINGKEVQSIIIKDTGAVLYEKSGEEDRIPLEFTFTGKELTQYDGATFSGTNMVIDYGDGTVESTTGTFGHTYETDGIYTVKIYGITSLGNYCFRGCTGLTSITIPDSVTSLGSYCFYNCTGLTSITIPDSVTSLGAGCFRSCTGLINYYLNWDSASSIIQYDSDKMPNNTNTIFHIPLGTIQLYINAGYPSDKLEEFISGTITYQNSSGEPLDIEERPKVIQIEIYYKGAFLDTISISGQQDSYIIYLEEIDFVNYTTESETTYKDVDDFDINNLGLQLESITRYYSRIDGFDIKLTKISGDAPAPAPSPEP